MNRLAVSLILLSLAGLVVGCSGRNDAPPLSEKPAAADRAKPEDKAAAVKAGNAFALDLYGQLRDQKSNLFLSPYSISTALTMTSAGARGDTVEQMRKTLHLDLPDDRLHPALAALSWELRGQGKDPGYELSVANALWAQQGLAFQPEFVQLNKGCYGAGLREVDFGKSDQARSTINDWVKKETREKIPELLQPGDVTRDTRLVLTNAIYFKGVWVKRFDKARTRDELFYLKKGELADVPMMGLTDHFKYLEGDGFQALELPYRGDRLAMVIFVPHGVEGLPVWEKGLTAEKLLGWLAKMRKEEVSVKLPRFTMRSRFKLAPTLGRMGMTLPFTDKADFSGMTTAERLFIGDVIHEAFVEVNEEGTEAAAATAVEMTKGEDGPRVRFFHADRPFFFILRDTTTGSILFVGRVTDPRK